MTHASTVGLPFGLRILEVGQPTDGTEPAGDAGRRDRRRSARPSANRQPAPGHCGRQRAPRSPAAGDRHADRENSHGSRRLRPSHCAARADDAALGRLRQRAEQRADGQYSLVSSVGPTPGEWIDDYAALLGTMSTDEPIGGLDVRREIWDAARVRMLGHLIKTANLIRVQLAHPGLKRLHTWNAAENTHMLAVNVAHGYTVASVGGQWQLRVAATS